MSYNKVVLVGNLTRDIEIRYSQSGAAIANTAIATSHKFTSNGKKKEETCFTDITFFGKSAEIANQYLRRGSKILVDGRLKQDQWVDQGGAKRSKHSVIVESMQMLDSKPDKEQQQEREYSGVPQQQHTAYREQDAKQKQQPYTNYQQPSFPVIDIDEDSIPF